MPAIHSLTRVCFGFVTGVLLVCTAVQASDDNFDRLISWFSGSWDNQAQVNDEVEADVPPFEQHPHYAMVYVPVQTPDMSGQLFAIKSYNEDGFNGPLSRVALHRFSLVKGSDEIQHEFLFLLEPEKWGDLKQGLEPLQKLSLDDVRINENCRIYWRWQGDHFEGATRKGQCITSSYTETEILVEGHALLFPDRLQRHDMNYELSGEIRPRQGGASPEVFLKSTALP